VKRRRFAPEPPRFKPVAVIDIGSNSVRLVVYDGLRRAPSAVFNEKILCGLGRGVALTGKLAEDGIVRALKALRRFAALNRQIGVEEVFAVATAAAREASNGRQFINAAEDILGRRIDILSGKREAKLAASGVMSGIPEADGIVGDLGGGSLELIDVKKGKIRDGITLPLGPLQLIDLSGGSLTKAAGIIDAALTKARLLAGLKGRDFYAVGGTWRNLARLQMNQARYPLNIVQNYTLPCAGAQAVANLVGGLSATSLKDIKAVSRSRTDTLPYGALVLSRLLEAGKPGNVVFSAFGVREGLIHAKLKKRKRDDDPLLAGCWDFARRYARSPDHELELCDWTDSLFAGLGTETEAERRLRHAACLLADIGWRTHPDYRGARSLNLISQSSLVGLDHPGRIFLALTVYFRHEGPGANSAPRDFLRLVDEAMLERARRIAAALRLAYALTAAMPGVLPDIALTAINAKTLQLILPARLADLMGEPVQKRLDNLAELTGRTAEVVVK
jgi:exopolyphosphatase/guanosine-5'-triphosphate,3'-diphosphate pyrophosphatase